jgi:hypothetical protein
MKLGGAVVNPYAQEFVCGVGVALSAKVTLTVWSESKAKPPGLA